jgi:alpha-tubulin suppressor-like RCC1 family protein
VSGTLVFSSISAGDRHTCGVTTGNALYCWGNGFSGELGNGAVSDANTPQQIGSQFTWAGVDAGGNQTCAYTTGNNVAYCWGNNERGQLGYNRRTVALVPQIVLQGPQAAPPVAGIPGIEEPFGPAFRPERGPGDVRVEGAAAHGSRRDLPR